MLGEGGPEGTRVWCEEGPGPRTDREQDSSSLLDSISVKVVPTVRGEGGLTLEEVPPSLTSTKDRDRGPGPCPLVFVFIELGLLGNPLGTHESFRSRSVGRTTEGETTDSVGCRTQTHRDDPFLVREKEGLGV